MKSRRYSGRGSKQESWAVATTAGPKVVAGYQYEVLLVHQSLNYYNEYTITHIPSGLAVGWTNTLGQARRAARALLAADVVPSEITIESYHKFRPVLNALYAAGVLHKVRSS